VVLAQEVGSFVTAFGCGSSSASSLDDLVHGSFGCGVGLQLGSLGALDSLASFCDCWTSSYGAVVAVGSLSGLWVDGFASPVLWCCYVSLVGYGVSGSSVGFGVTVNRCFGVDVLLPMLFALLVVVLLLLLVLHLVYSTGQVSLASGAVFVAALCRVNV